MHCLAQKELLLKKQTAQFNEDQKNKSCRCRKKMKKAINGLMAKLKWLMEI
jgi:hypothetical protein